MIIPRSNALSTEAVGAQRNQITDNCATTLVLLTYHKCRVDRPIIARG